MLKTEEKVSLNIEDKGVIDDQKMINIASDLSYNHGDDFIIYDVREKSPFLSYYIVVSYSNESRLKKGVSVAEESLYNNNIVIDHKEGKNKSRWILIDGKEVVLQLFLKDERKRIDFDSLYLDSPHKVIVSEKEINYEKREK